jgi:hypothetical protein
MNSTENYYLFISNWTNTLCLGNRNLYSKNETLSDNAYMALGSNLSQVDCFIYIYIYI